MLLRRTHLEGRGCICPRYSFRPSACRMQNRRHPSLPCMPKPDIRSWGSTLCTGCIEHPKCFDTAARRKSPPSPDTLCNCAPLRPLWMCRGWIGIAVGLPGSRAASWSHHRKSTLRYTPCRSGEKDKSPGCMRCMWFDRPGPWDASYPRCSCLQGSWCRWSPLWWHCIFRPRRLSTAQAWRTQLDTFRVSRARRHLGLLKGRSRAGIMLARTRPLCRSAVWQRGPLCCPHLQPLSSSYGNKGQ